MGEWQDWNSESFGFKSPDIVHLWLVPLRISESFISKLFAILSEDEQQRARRFHFEKDRRNYIAARGHLRLLLARYLNSRPQTIQFDYNAFGKPYLHHEADYEKAVFFNISHSHQMALMGFSSQWELGVDIEWMKPDFDGLHLVHRFFSANEIEQINALPDHLKREAFFNGWTRKEAYIKARGKGLNIPLAKFSVELRPGYPARLLETSHEPQAVHQWALQALPAPDEYKAAVAVHSPEFKVKLWKINSDDPLLK